MILALGGSTTEGSVGKSKDDDPEKLRDNRRSRVTRPGDNDGSEGKRGLMF